MKVINLFDHATHTAFKRRIIGKLKARKIEQKRSEFLFHKIAEWERTMIRLQYSRPKKK